jgi:hypothetical protein
MRITQWAERRCVKPPPPPPHLPRRPRTPTDAPAHGKVPQPRRRAAVSTKQTNASTSKWSRPPQPVRRAQRACATETPAVTCAPRAPAPVRHGRQRAAQPLHTPRPPRVPAQSLSPRVPRPRPRLQRGTRGVHAGSPAHLCGRRGQISDLQIDVATSGTTARKQAQRPNAGAWASYPAPQLRDAKENSPRCASTAARRAVASAVAALAREH